MLLKFFAVVPKRFFMLLLTLLGAFVLLTSVVALVYAFRTAVDGREDESGFHFTGSRREQLAVIANAERRANTDEHDASSVVMGSRPAA